MLSTRAARRLQSTCLKSFVTLTSQNIHTAVFLLPAPCCQAAAVSVINLCQGDTGGMQSTAHSASVHPCTGKWRAPPLYYFWRRAGRRLQVCSCADDIRQQTGLFAIDRPNVTSRDSCRPAFWHKKSLLRPSTSSFSGLVGCLYICRDATYVMPRAKRWSDSCHTY